MSKAVRVLQACKNNNFKLNFVGPETTTFFPSAIPWSTSFLKCVSDGFLTVHEFKIQRSAADLLSVKLKV